LTVEEKASTTCGRGEREREREREIIDLGKIGMCSECLLA
jgi:hypothetical protein